MRGACSSCGCCGANAVEVTPTEISRVYTRILEVSRSGTDGPRACGVAPYRTFRQETGGEVIESVANSYQTLEATGPASFRRVRARSISGRW